VENVPAGTTTIEIQRAGRLVASWPRLPIWDRWVKRHHARRLRSFAARTGGADYIAFIADPSFAPYLDLLAPRWTVFYIFDAWTPEGWGESLDNDAARSLSDNLRVLSERSDVIVSIAPSMVRPLPSSAVAKARFLPHGVDADVVEAASRSPCPSDLAQIKPPRIGYVGRINPKLDFHLIESLARRLPDFNWVFVGWTQGIEGEEQRSWERLLTLPNVYYLGRKPESDVGAYLAHMNVNVLCYRMEGAAYSWRAVFPIKLFEYLAAGKPVISSNLENVLPYAEVVDIAATTDEWTTALRRAIASGGVGNEAQRRSLARSNTWDSRADTLDAWLLEMMSRS
jgi:glycosyltransferase involved in cell wall biosynthesis